MIMEALAMTRPVIATAIAGIPELVDEECGWLIPAGSEEALGRGDDPSGWRHLRRRLFGKRD